MSKPGSTAAESVTPLDVWQVLAQEHAHLSEFKENDPAVPTDSTKLIPLLHKAERSALCLSGGGVRSAMFSLGVLQELARFSWKDPEETPNQTPEEKAGLLAEFDYLSTVSGGGYTGGWFTSWAARTSTKEVIKQLVRRPVDKLKPEPLPVTSIREYASFLNPRLGFTSADTWTLGTTILRNIVLNWLVLLPLLAAVLTIPRIIDALVQIPRVPLWIGYTVLIAAFLSGACACFYMVNDLPSAGKADWSQKDFLTFCLGAQAISGACTLLYWRWNTPISAGHVIEYTILVVLTGTLAAVFGSVRRRKKEKDGVSYSWIALGIACLTICAAFGGWLSYRTGLLFEVGNDPTSWDHRLYSWIALPVLIFIYGIFQIVLVGVTSRMTEDEDREWWARCAAWFTILMAAWIAGMGLVLYAESLVANSEHALLKLTGATTLFGAILSFLGFSGKTKSGRNDGAQAQSGPPSIPTRLRGYAVKLILPAFLVLLVLTLAIVNSRLSDLLRTHWEPLQSADAVVTEILLGVLLAAVSVIASFGVNANKFSLNGMYRLRLIRTFLGASNEKRRVSPLTGFDEKDNIKMAKLKSMRPLHVVNMALNLVKGDNLAWQQRKAESFTATPLHCGSMKVGYVDTESYSKGPNDPESYPKGGPDEPVEKFSGLSLGSALTISGAAASPNMGYHSSPLLTIVMTLFNARLGAWLANPGKHGQGFWAASAPEFALTSFIDEAFGRTTDTNRWVYLSDGGHFENLGLYEMVLRRCHRIVIIDGSADPDYSFEDLGNAVRKIRIDFGIEIEFKGDFPIFKKENPGAQHYAYGEIKYSCVDDGALPGKLVYIKTSLTGDEPRDVLNYASQNSSFPQQPTYDLWFDEAQLESYRRLGSHIIQDICGDNGSDRKIYSVADFVNRVSDKVSQGSATHPN
jgi:hypothetical protein